MDVVHLVNKTQVFGRITRWLLSFLQYDLKIIHKLGRSHVLPNALSTIYNTNEHISVLNQTIDFALFMLGACTNGWTNLGVI